MAYIYSYLFRILKKMISILSRYEKTIVNCVILQIYACFSPAQFSVKKESEFLLFYFQQNMDVFFCHVKPGVHYFKRHCNSCFVFLFIPIKIYYTFATSRTIARQAPLSKVTGVGCHSLLQGLFLTQGQNPHLLCLLRCKRIIYH